MTDLDSLFAQSNRITAPLDKETVHEISVCYGNVAHIVVMRCARNECWKAWHAEESSVARIQAEVGYRVLQHVTSKLVERMAETLVHDSHA